MISFILKELPNLSKYFTLNSSGKLTKDFSLYIPKLAFSIAPSSISEAKTLISFKSKT